MSFSPETLALAKQYTDKKIASSGGGGGSPVISVSDEFYLSQYGELYINQIQPSKIIGLPEAMEKLNTIESGAETNKINVIKINNIEIPVNNKEINIPIATHLNLGVVLSGNQENQIMVNQDGTMEVVSLNISKIVQDEGSEIILNSGTSQI